MKKTLIFIIYTILGYLFANNSDELRDKQVIINLGKWWTSRLYSEVFMGVLIRLCKGKVTILLDDKPHLTYFNDKGDVNAIRPSKFHRKSLGLVTIFTGIRFKTYSAILQETRLDEIELDKLDYSHIRAHIIKITQTDDTGVIEEHIRNETYIYNYCYQNCLIGKAIALTILNEFSKSTLFLSSHGVYTYYGSTYTTLKEGEFSCILYAHHPIQKGLMFSDSPFQVIIDDNRYKYFVANNNLSVDQLNVLDEYFEKRNQKKASDTSIYFKQIVEDDGLFTKIKKHKKLCYGIFPNLIWDGNVKERHRIFKSYIEWIKKLIDVAFRTDNLYIIRFHPSEATMFKNTKSFFELLDEYDWFKKRPVNVICVRSNEAIDTYELMKHIDIGIVYDGTIAGELVMNNKPVIGCGYGRCSDPDWTFLPKSISDFENWLTLDGGLSLIDEFNRNYAVIKLNMQKNYFYYNFENCLHLSYITSIRPRKINFSNMKNDILDENLRNKFSKILKFYE